ncbi:MAG TPA: hypothetical protein VFH78_15625 [Candidatus Thermoplasmatota archaeon]|nr:hypothetical protein [Candidatus Thermoplasmatota archaeon]
MRLILAVAIFCFFSGCVALPDAPAGVTEKQPAAASTFQLHETLGDGMAVFAEWKGTKVSWTLSSAGREVNVYVMKPDQMQRMMDGASFEYISAASKLGIRSGSGGTGNAALQEGTWRTVVLCQIVDGSGCGDVRASGSAS